MTEPIDVEFDASVYSLGALNAAAYRMIGTATCQIIQQGPRYVCRLAPARTTSGTENVRDRFLDFVTDECLRERLATQTEPIRNLILSLAFGSLASKHAAGE
jgi:His-Xaa-Ser system protein HxsD